MVAEGLEELLKERAQHLTACLEDRAMAIRLNLLDVEMNTFNHLAQTGLTHFLASKSSPAESSAHPIKSRTTSSTYMSLHRPVKYGALSFKTRGQHYPVRKHNLDFLGTLPRLGQDRQENNNHLQLVHKIR